MISWQGSSYHPDMSQRSFGLEGCGGDGWILCNLRHFGMGSLKDGVATTKWKSLWD